MPVGFSRIVGRIAASSTGRVSLIFVGAVGAVEWPDGARDGSRWQLRPSSRRHEHEPTPDEEEKP